MIHRNRPDGEKFSGFVRTEQPLAAAARRWKLFVRFGDPVETEVERAAGRAGFD